MGDSAVVWGGAFVDACLTPGCMRLISGCVTVGIKQQVINVLNGST